MSQEIVDKKFFKTCSLPIMQYDSTTVEVPGICDSTQSIVAIATARPGKTAFVAKEGSSSPNMNRTLMFGDIGVFSFIKTGEHEENGETIIDGQLGAEVMQSKSWLVLQVKDSTTGEEKPPYVRSPWDVKMTASGNYGAMQPATLSPQIRKLAEEAINLASEILAEKIENNIPIRTQSDLAKAANAATRMATAYASRKTSTITQQQTTTIPSTEGAVTAEDLDI